MTTDTDTLRLSEPYRYDGEQMFSIPYTDLSDLGGAVLIVPEALTDYQRKHYIGVSS